MRIAILGTENSHADAFAQLVRDDRDFAGMTIVGAYGFDETANQRLRDKGLINRFADRPDAFVDEVDGVLVTARHGDLHHEYAMPYLEKGIAAFIDKPITVSGALADEMLAAAEAHGALVCGGSSLKYLRELDTLIAFQEGKRILGGHVSAPINMVNAYAGFHFYAQHLIEMMFRVFGTDVRIVYAYCPDSAKNRIAVVFDYGDFDVTAHYYDGYTYTATVYTDKGSLHISAQNLGDIYKQELMAFKTMAETRVMPHSYAYLKKPGILMRLIEASYTAGRMLPVHW